jgi:hypothetical protein
MLDRRVLTEKPSSESVMEVALRIRPNWKCGSANADRHRSPTRSVNGACTVIVPNHRERQIMQYLRHGGWVRASALPAGTRLIDGLKGWIEQEILEGDVCFG